MNCFEFETRTSEYLDDLLPESLKPQAQQHLESCKKCKERSKRFQTILNQIHNIKKMSVPLRLRSDALQGVRESLPISSRLAQWGAAWGRLPWLPKSLIQTLLISTLIVFSVGIVPEIRYLYEKQTQKKLDGAQLENLAQEFKHLDGRPAAPTQSSLDSTPSTEAQESDGFEGEYESEEEGDSAQSSLKAGRGEIWRFILRSESPREYRSKVVELFKNLQMPTEKREFQGLEVPGGIQFDFLVEREKIGSVKDGLSNLSKGVSESIGLPSGVDSFTWYKNRSKKPLPEGKTRVILWLSQI